MNERGLRSQVKEETVCFINDNIINTHSLSISSEQDLLLEIKSYVCSFKISHLVNVIDIQLEYTQL